MGLIVALAVAARGERPSTPEAEVLAVAEEWLATQYSDDWNPLYELSVRPDLCPRAEFEGLLPDRDALSDFTDVQWEADTFVELRDKQAYVGGDFTFRLGESEFSDTAWIYLSRVDGRWLIHRNACDELQDLNFMMPTSRMIRAWQPHFASWEETGNFDIDPLAERWASLGLESDKPPDNRFWPRFQYGTPGSIPSGDEVVIFSDADSLMAVTQASDGRYVCRGYSGEESTAFRWLESISGLLTFDGCLAGEALEFLEHRVDETILFLPEG